MYYEDQCVSILGHLCTFQPLILHTPVFGLYFNAEAKICVRFVAAGLVYIVHFPAVVKLELPACPDSCGTRSMLGAVVSLPLKTTALGFDRTRQCNVYDPS